VDKNFLYKAANNSTSFSEFSSVRF